MKKILQILLAPLILFSCARLEGVNKPKKHLEDAVLENHQMDATVARRSTRPRPHGSIPTILVDFDGHYVDNTMWNTNGPIDATTSGYGVGDINQIISIVSSYYDEFNDSVLITTDERIYNRAPYDKKTRVIVTAYYQWYGSGYGGVAYINSFTWGDDTPCFVFNTLYGNDIEYVAHAIAHEAGHTIGLRHHCDYNESCIKVNEYHYGCVMGQYAGYPSVFDIGPNSLGCNIIIDEHDFIQSKL